MLIKSDEKLNANGKVLLGIALHSSAPESFRVCVYNILRYLPEMYFECVITNNPDELAAMDVVWDPCAGGGRLPHEEILSLNVPLVITLHGVAPFALKSKYTYGFRACCNVIVSNFVKRRLWKNAQYRCAKIVTVSEFSKNSILRYLPINKEKVEVIYNGVDCDKYECRDYYFPLNNISKPYFLHISNDERRKNVDGILAAYNNLDPSSRWPLVLKLNGLRSVSMSGVHVVNERLSDDQIAALYQRAGVFVFPSFYEGFGLPILEAMAAGCPVITSNENACCEIAGNAALKVSPSSKSQLAVAMFKLMNDRCLRESLVERGSLRAKEFDWRVSAEKFSKLFIQVASQGV